METTDRDVLLRSFSDIHRAVADCELEGRSASACSRTHRSLGYTRFLAGRESLVSVYDLPTAQNFGIDVAIESRRQIDVYRSRREPNVRTAPSSMEIR